MGIKKDLTGTTVNGIYIHNLSTNNGRNYWNVTCSCGSPRIMISSEINRHNGKCSCLKNMEGKEFVKFSVGKYTQSKSQNRHYGVTCKWCGNHMEASTKQLIRGTDFCGCQKQDVEFYDSFVEVTVHSKRIGFKVLMDTEDYYNIFKNNSWCLSGNYVGSRMGGDKFILLHRAICNTPADLVTDHISGDTLDNRKENLRPVTQKVNSKNCKKSVNNKSGEQGVLLQSNGMYKAYIQVDGASIDLGRSFLNVEEAVESRKKGEKLYGFHSNHGRVNTKTYIGDDTL